MHPLKIGLDFDDTITKAPDMFKEIIRVIRSFGNEVHIVTARDKGCWCEMLREFEPLVNSVVFCSNVAKDDIAVIDIWIDDFPLAITHDFKETCWVPGKGVTKRMEVKV